MATRSLTSSYQELRAARRKGQPVKINIPEPTPQWVLLHDQSQKALQTSKEQLLILQTLQQENSRVEFAVEKKKSTEVRLCIVEKNIQEIFQMVQKNIHQIALVENDASFKNNKTYNFFQNCYFDFFARNRSVVKATKSNPKVKRN